VNFTYVPAHVSRASVGNREIQPGLAAVSAEKRGIDLLDMDPAVLHGLDAVADWGRLCRDRRRGAARQISQQRVLKKQVYLRPVVLALAAVVGTEAAGAIEISEAGA
jgi:hypothetical protein